MIFGLTCATEHGVGPTRETGISAEVELRAEKAKNFKIKFIPSKLNSRKREKDIQSNVRILVVRAKRNKFVRKNL